MSTSGLNKLLSEARFIEIWSRKDARNRPSLVENLRAEDKSRRVEENSEGRSALLKTPSENPGVCVCVCACACVNTMSNNFVK